MGEASGIDYELSDVDEVEPLYRDMARQSTCELLWQAYGDFNEILAEAVSQCHSLARPLTV